MKAPRRMPKTASEMQQFIKTHNEFADRLISSALHQKFSDKDCDTLMLVVMETLSEDQQKILVNYVSNNAIYIRECLAQRIDLCKAVAEKLSDDTYVRVLTVLAENTPFITIQRKLTSCKSKEVVASLANNIYLCRSLMQTALEAERHLTIQGLAHTKQVEDAIKEILGL